MVIKQLCMSKSNKQPPSYFIQNWKNFVIVLANSVNANCCPFQVKNICSKFITKIYRDPYIKSLFIIDGLQQRCYMTWLIFLFVTLRNIWFGVFLPKNLIAILRKITAKFRQVSLKDVFLSVGFMEYYGKIL